MCARVRACEGDVAPHRGTASHIPSQTIYSHGSSQQVPIPCVLSKICHYSSATTPCSSKVLQFFQICQKSRKMRKIRDISLISKVPGKFQENLNGSEICNYSFGKWECCINKPGIATRNCFSRGKEKTFSSCITSRSPEQWHVLGFLKISRRKASSANRRPFPIP